MLTGSDGDYTVKMWDMQTMNSNLRPFKEFKPFDKFASTFLCCCANNQARVYKNDGSKLLTTVRGDMYI